MTPDWLLKMDPGLEKRETWGTRLAQMKLRVREIVAVGVLRLRLIAAQSDCAQDDTFIVDGHPPATS